MGKSIAQLIADGDVPARPNLKFNAARRAWDRLVADHYIAYCRDHARTWIYVDSAAGSDANDGLSEAAPKQTLTAAVALLAPNVGIRLKRGSVFYAQNALLDEAGSAIADYGEGPLPILWRPALIAGTWTNQGGGRYTITVADTDTAIVLMGDPDDPEAIETILDRPFQRVQTTTAQPEGTYHHSGTTLSVRLYGSVDPNTVKVWRVNRTATLPDGPGIDIANVDRVYVGNVRVIGYGRNPSDQLYNIRSRALGTNVHAIVGTRVHHNAGHHVIGNFRPGFGESRGITVWKDNHYGFCTHDENGLSAVFVDFVKEGGTTLFFHDNLCDGGQVDYASNGSGVNAIDLCVPNFMHDDGTPTVKVIYASFVGNRYKTRAGNKISKTVLTDIATVAVPTDRFDLDQYTVVIMDESYEEGQIPSGNLTGFSQTDGMARIGYKWGEMFLRRAAGPAPGATLGPVRGVIGNGEASFIVDPAEGSSWFSVFYGATGNATMSCALVYNHWRITWTGAHGPTARYYSDSATSSGEVQAYGCVFGYNNLTDPTGGTFTSNQLWVADNAAPTFTGATGNGGFSQCGFYRCNPTAGGFASSHDPLDLTVSFGVGTTQPLIPFGSAPEADSPLVGHADSPPAALAFTHDIDGVLRYRSTIGPYEARQTVGGVATRAAREYWRRRIKRRLIEGELEQDG